MITRLIKQFEGLRLEAYRCPAGIWTIGYGHTAGVSEGMKITEVEAERLLLEDLKPVLAVLPSGLNANRRAALASFVFNVGVGAFCRSTIRRLVIENLIIRGLPMSLPAGAMEAARCSRGLLRAVGLKLNCISQNRRRNEKDCTMFHACGIGGIGVCIAQAVGQRVGTAVSFRHPFADG